MYLKISRDFLIGGVIAGIFSYLTNQYDRNPEYTKIAAYFWGIPALFFVLLYVGFRKSDEAALAISQHALLGVVITLFAMLPTIGFFSIGEKNLMILNVFILMLSIFVYMFFKLYKL